MALTRAQHRQYIQDVKADLETARSNLVAERANIAAAQARADALAKRETHLVGLLAQARQRRLDLFGESDE